MRRLYVMRRYESDFKSIMNTHITIIAVVYTVNKMNMKEVGLRPSHVKKHFKL